MQYKCPTCSCLVNEGEQICPKCGQKFHWPAKPAQLSNAKVANRNIVELKRSVCSNCGADLKFDPNSQTLKCKQCDQSFPIIQYKTSDELIQTQKISRCPNCGANLRFDPNYQVAICDHCDATFNIIEKTRKGEDNGKRKKGQSHSLADYIVPFKIDEKKAQHNYINWIADKGILPNDFFQKLKSSYFKGVYVPAYYYELSYSADFTYSAGYYYYETVMERKQVTENGYTHYSYVPKEERRVRYEPAAGSTYGDYSCRCISTDFFDKYAFVNNSFFGSKGLEPFFDEISDSGMVSFDNRYLSGFSTLPFGLNKDEAFEKKVKKKFADAVENNISRHMVGDTHSDLNYHCTWNTSTNLLYLPVYIAKLNYEDINLIALIDGASEDPRVVGTIPKAKGRLIGVLLFFAFFALFFNILALIMIGIDGVIIHLIEAAICIAMSAPALMSCISFNKKMRVSKKEGKEFALKKIDGIFNEKNTDIPFEKISQGRALGTKSAKFAIPKWTIILLIIAFILSVAFIVFAPDDNSTNNVEETKVTTSTSSYGERDNKANYNAKSVTSTTANTVTNDDSSDVIMNRESNNSQVKINPLNKTEIVGKYEYNDGIIEITENYIRIYDSESKYKDIRMGYEVDLFDDYAIITTTEGYKDEDICFDYMTFEYYAYRLYNSYHTADFIQPKLVYEDEYDNCWSFFPIGRYEYSRVG